MDNIDGPSRIVCSFSEGGIQQPPYRRWPRCNNAKKHSMNRISGLMPAVRTEISIRCQGPELSIKSESMNFFVGSVPPLGQNICPELRACDACGTHRRRGCTRRSQKTSKSAKELKVYTRDGVIIRIAMLRKKCKSSPDTRTAFESFTDRLNFNGSRCRERKNPSKAQEAGYHEGSRDPTSTAHVSHSFRNQ